MPTRTPASSTATNPATTPGPTDVLPQTFAPPPQPINIPFFLTGDSTKHGSWPPRWRKFLGLARTFALCDLLFVHGFPTAFVLRNRAGEALTHAWEVFALENPHEPLEKGVCKMLFPFYDHCQ